MRRDMVCFELSNRNAAGCSLGFGDVLKRLARIELKRQRNTHSSHDERQNGKSHVGVVGMPCSVTGRVDLAPRKQSVRAPKHDERGTYGGRSEVQHPIGRHQHRGPFRATWDDRTEGVVGTAGAKTNIAKRRAKIDEKSSEKSEGQPAVIIVTLTLDTNLPNKPQTPPCCRYGSLVNCRQPAGEREALGWDSGEPTPEIRLWMQSIGPRKPHSGRAELPSAGSLAESVCPADQVYRQSYQ
jgi:hypothetical protein